jgi:hypothetical protein
MSIARGIGCGAHFSAEDVLGLGTGSWISIANDNKNIHYSLSKNQTPALAEWRGNSANMSASYPYQT